jgi:TatD DNase family protein
MKCSPLQLIDSHCHLDFPDFADDLASVFDRANRQGVQQFLVPGVAASNWQAVLELARKYPGVYPALGLHPHFLASYQPEQLNLLAQLIEDNPAVVAIGEIGLDKSIDFPFTQQLVICQQQLELAQRYNLPVIIHCRKAHNELLRLLLQVKLNRGGVIHGFSGSLELAQRYVKLGFKLGIGGVITYPRAKKTRHAVTHLPLSALLLETDSPGMPLAGNQGLRNEPESINTILCTLNMLRKEPMEVTYEAICCSFYELFKPN